ncbi:MAG TPA: hypothetical protein ENK56_07270 [Chloroflexi bacterium]|nr:hypothetical protein [Chloroflexota bacterium]
MGDEPYDQVPDWLRKLEGPGEAEPSEPTPARPGGDEPLLEGLREQAFEADLGVPEEPTRPGLAGMLQGLAPWQRFVLALLLFLDVALLGCMCLVMTGRVVPFQ